MVPIENSLAGRVADIHYLLTKYKLQIYSEHFQKVEHNLLAKEFSIGTIILIFSSSKAILKVSSKVAQVLIVALGNISSQAKCE